MGQLPVGPRGFFHLRVSSQVVLALCKVSCEKKSSRRRCTPKPNDGGPSPVVGSMVCLRLSDRSAFFGTLTLRRSSQPHLCHGLAVPVGDDFPARRWTQIHLRYPAIDAAYR